MVRNYKKLPGTRKYKSYTEDKLEEALEKITDGEMSIRAAHNAYNIPFGTLYNRYKGLHGKPAGGQTSFTFEEEKSLLKAAATCSDWGFPLTTFDLRMIAKAYLDRQGKTVRKFSNNIPGVDWAASLLKRHKGEFGQKVASNIKRARAEINRKTLSNYFDNLEKEVDGVPPSHIFNYDESNLADDPGKVRCIYRRGVKYPERMLNFSKSCTTIMMCGSADGTLLPPYVIYKSVHLYDTWKERGIVGEPCCAEPCCSRGSKYNRTQSGWIDAPTFRDWFTTVFLPHAKRLDGRKVIIGDNLSAHLDADVLNICEQNNISFVCLVPHSTHICQPLDVGFFRPMKVAWRKVLEQWKLTHQKAACVPKEVFPSLLKQAIIKMNEVPEKTPSEHATPSAIKRNLKSSFRATGIYPFNKNVVLKKVPDTSNENADGDINEVLTEYLREQRFGNASDQQPRRKKKRLQVEPGRSIHAVEEVAADNVTEEILESNEVLNNILQEDNINRSPLEVGPSTTSLLPADKNEPEGTHAEPSSSVDAGPSNEVNNNNDGDSDVTRCEGPEVCNFVLAKFPSLKGKVYRYVCVIEDVNDRKLVVKGLKSHRKDKRTYRIVDDDVSIIEETDIVMYLPNPKWVNDFYVFPTAVNVKEL